MTKNINSRRKRLAIENRQLHVVLSMIDSGIDLLTSNPVTSDKRVDSALETIARWRKAAFGKLEPLGNRAVKSKDHTFNEIRRIILETFPENDFGTEEWMHYWLAVNMQLDTALNLEKIPRGSRAPWRYMDQSSMKLIRALAGPMEHELYEVGSVEDTDPLLGTAVGEALTDIIWSE
ncbi:hypothetical protein [Maridesulfovibrio sp.]|uniref:hypothetical protein n=1 Tax=Maridesulfovibrio sp. TaxID=2795000 RepID=UPI0029CA1228|nr:hypothetical protein [Maridesulfovibrio sp.]